MRRVLGHFSDGPAGGRRCHRALEIRGLGAKEGKDFPEATGPQVAKPAPPALRPRLPAVGPPSPALCGPCHLTPVRAAPRPRAPYAPGDGARPALGSAGWEDEPGGGRPSMD